MNELKINGTQKFMEIDIPIIEGGFGENCRVTFDKTIADIHNVTPSEIRKSINRLLKKGRLIENIDYIQLVNSLPVEVINNLLLNIGVRKQDISKAKEIFVMSERGYSKIIKAMDDDTSWDVMDKFIDEYFTMREVINSDESKKANLLLLIYKGGQEGVLASKELSNMEVKEATAPLLQKIEEDKPYTDFAKHVTESSDSVDVGEFSKIVKNENIDIGRNRLFSWLREQKYLMSNNTPYQKYINNGYFDVIETHKDTAYGPKIFSKTLIKGKGQVALVEELRKEYGEKNLPHAS